ncbi:MAG TPA: thiamine phosphate synthase, partial [Candidatus Acidoferrales bacterium]|nr:thiamine phosphate synthase [Candidatus Acidoferrales bacterium]
MPEARQAIVCYVTDRLSLGAAPDPPVDPTADETGELLAKVRLAIQAGADWVQIREKDLPGRALLDLTRDSIAAANGVARVHVNDRLDIAIAAGAAGVHLGG